MTERVEERGGTMAIDAVAAAGSTSPTVTVDADVLRSVTLAQMIDTRMSTGLGDALSTASAGIGALGLSQAPMITVPAGGSSTQVPDVLRAYGNGRIPRELLTLIGIGQHRLWGPAAEAFKSMRAAAATDGVNISVTDSYRTYDQQVTLASEKGLTQNGGWAAVPGTSEHGWGLAVDVDVDKTGLAWLRANGATYGFVEPATREPWHWEYHGAT
ncbi:MAG: M15 family metallopeptidase [Ilumatobacteraceae bacterium]